MSISLNEKDYIAYNVKGISNFHTQKKKKTFADYTKAIHLSSKSAVKNKKMFCK